MLIILAIVFAILATGSGILGFLLTVALLAMLARLAAGLFFAAFAVFLIVALI